MHALKKLVEKHKLSLSTIHPTVKNRGLSCRLLVTFTLLSKLEI